MNTDEKILALQRQLNRLSRSICCLNSEGSGGDSVVQVDTIADMMLVNPEESTTVIVDNNGIYKYTTDVLTPNGYSIVTATGGYWILTNSTQIERTTPTEYMVMADVIPGGITDGFESVTKTGVISTAIFSKVGNYDKVAVTGGATYANFLIFNNQRIQDNGMSLNLRLKVDTVGATLPLIGIGVYATANTHDTVGTGLSGMYVINLLTKVVENRSYDCSATGLTPKSSAGMSLASNGDILNIKLSYSLDLGSYKTLTVINETTGSFAYYQVGSSPNCAGFKVGMKLALALTDGDYTILEYKAYSSIPQKALLGIIGDSYGTGYSVALENSITGKIRRSLPEYDIACFAASGAYQITMANYQMRDILKLRPKYVLIFQILQVYWGFFDNGDADQTEYDNNMTSILDGITGYGGIPILVKWQAAGGYINGNSAAWDIKRAAHISTYPSILTLDMSASALALNNNSHPTAADNIKIADKVVELLKAQGAI